jgi:hypothetical protein
MGDSESRSSKGDLLVFRTGKVFGRHVSVLKRDSSQIVSKGSCRSGFLHEKFNLIA